MQDQPTLLAESVAVEMPGAKHGRHLKAGNEEKGEAVERKSIFARAREAVCRIFGSIRDRLRRGFYWVRSRFSTRDDLEI